MSKQRFLKDYVHIVDIQAERLGIAYRNIKKMLPLTAKKLQNPSESELAFLDMFSGRFSKLQDLIGNKIFPFIIDIEQETAPSQRDKLNKLEKLGYLEDVHWWDALRDIRNKLAHDYPDDYDLLADDFTVMAGRAEELLNFWEELKKKIKKLM